MAGTVRAGARVGAIASAGAAPYPAGEGAAGEAAMVERGQRALGDIAVHSRLADGTAVCLRTITPGDAPLLRQGIATLSAEARYLRFFSPAPALPEPVIARLVDVDGHDHIAWGALCTECEGTPARARRSAGSAPRPTRSRSPAAAAAHRPG